MNNDFKNMVDDGSDAHTRHGTVEIAISASWSAADRVDIEALAVLIADRVAESVHEDIAQGLVDSVCRADAEAIAAAESDFEEMRKIAAGFDEVEALERDLQETLRNMKQEVQARGVRGLRVKSLFLLLLVPLVRLLSWCQARGHARLTAREQDMLREIRQSARQAKRLCLEAR